MNDVTTGVVRGFLRNDSAPIAFDSPDTTPNKKGKTDLRVKKVELVVRCQELSRFLRGLDELHWADWLDECIGQIREHSVAGIETLLDGYSGIGSISDMYMCPEANHRVTARDEAAINEQFLLMLAKVNILAREIQRFESPKPAKKAKRKLGYF